MKLSKVVGGLAALLPSLSAYGQLLIDAGGPRDVFFFSGPTAAGLDGLHIKVDTSRKGLDFDYLGYPTTALSLENVLLGGAVKATAVDGLEQFFRFERLPKIELLLLANKTWRRLIDPDHAWIWSLTSRINGSYADYALFDTSRPVGSQYFKRGFIGGEIIETISLGLPWSPDGFAFSGGVRTTSNYENLPKTTVGTLQTTYPGAGGATMAAVSGGQTARFGVFNSFNEFPLSFIHNRTFGQEKLSNFISSLPFMDKDSTYNILASPYGSFVPRDEGKPTHSLGLNLVLRKFKKGPELNPEESKVSFPLGIFVERKNVFGGKPDTKVGAALIYHFK